ncbi:hypothetical protein ACRZ5S_22930 (plasmid) [Vibrio scophthalmi]|uniref:hypothetical protein n=1 Tax=Vibrio scophthalmi TaxID=45658 RepID=UPI003EB7CAB9
MKSLHESMLTNGVFAQDQQLDAAGSLTGQFQAEFGQIGQYCQLTHPEKNKLVIGVPSAPVRTRLNFMRNDILKWAKGYDADIESINIVITPELSYK